VTSSPSSSSWNVRTLTEADEAEFHRVDSLAFAETVAEEVVHAELPLHEQDRKIGAFDGETLAGIAMAYSYRLSVPGGEAPAAGVSWVGVRPTHRRRGVLSALMRHQLREIHEVRREPIAILWASEPMIYGRFGYGLATSRYQLEVARSATALLASAPSDRSLRLRIMDDPDAALLAPVYEGIAQTRAGLPRRDDRWWARVLRDHAGQRGGASALRCVVAADAGGVRGYALYRTKQIWDLPIAAGTVTVKEIMGLDAAALAELYRFILDQDLMTTTNLWNVPVDDPLLVWLADPRRAQPKLVDSLFVRVVDVSAALETRRYAADVDVVLDVADGACPWNAGRWRFTAKGGTASCARTEDAPDVGLSADALGSLYLGGGSLQQLASAGLVEEHAGGAVADLDAAFRWFPAPWSPQVF
jgi:predicted acetyltransferase